MKTIKVKATMEHFDEVMNFVSACCEEFECSMKTQMIMELAADELFANVSSYAYVDREIGNVEVVMDVMDGMVMMTFIDQGIPYNPLEKVDPDITLSAEDRKIGGLGIFMVKKKMDDCFYEYRDGSNVFIMKKKL